MLPIYLAALVWPIMALVLPIYTLGGLDRHGGHQRGRVHRGHKTLPRARAGCRSLTPPAVRMDALLNGVTANLDAL